MSTRYWIIVASREHVKRGEAQGFAQACHGKATPLKRMKAGDWIIYYSSKMQMDKPEKCQCFTAIGTIIDEEVYQCDMGGGFVPWRKNVEFFPSEEVSILPLINDLQAIKNKKHWGGALRYGILEIPRHDFELIASHMNAAIL